MLDGPLESKGSESAISMLAADGDPINSTTKVDNAATRTIPIRLTDTGSNFLPPKIAGSNLDQQTRGLYPERACTSPWGMSPLMMSTKDAVKKSAKPVSWA